MPHSGPIRQPKLSELGIDLLRLSRWQLVCTIALPFIAFGAFWVLAALGYWTAAICCLVVLSFVTYGSTSHDLVHRNLGLKSGPNDILLSVIEALALRSGHAYQAAHLNHHARFPHDDDIEAQAARLSLLRALLDGFVFQFRIYFWALRNRRGRRNWIVGEGMVVLILISAAVAAFPWTALPAIYAALMIAGSWTIPLITSYLPHDPTASDKLHQTRLFRGLAARCLAWDHLYHLEHHLYPAVPHQNWPRLAQRLDPWLQAAKIEPVRVWR